MHFFYSSYWKSPDGRRFRLAGVIGASERVLAAYFPDDSDNQEEWNELARDDRLPPGTDARALLQQLSERGNGITEEYDSVREIDAPDLADLGQALRAAYDATVAERGSEIELYHETPKAEVRIVQDLTPRLLREEAPAAGDGRDTTQKRGQRRPGPGEKPRT